MQKIYKHPDDVDLFSGLLAEKKLHGALTGPTLACLLGLQFSHLRSVDTSPNILVYFTFSVSYLSLLKIPNDSVGFK